MFVKNIDIIFYLSYFLFICFKQNSVLCVNISFWGLIQTWEEKNQKGVEKYPRSQCIYHIFLCVPCSSVTWALPFLKPHLGRKKKTEHIKQILFYQNLKMHSIHNVLFASFINLNVKMLVEWFKTWIQNCYWFYAMITYTETNQILSIHSRITWNSMFGENFYGNNNMHCIKNYMVTFFSIIFKNINNCLILPPIKNEKI